MPARSVHIGHQRALDTRSQIVNPRKARLETGAVGKRPTDLHGRQIALDGLRVGNVIGNLHGNDSCRFVHDGIVFDVFVRDETALDGKGLHIFTAGHHQFIRILAGPEDQRRYEQSGNQMSHFHNYRVLNDLSNYFQISFCSHNVLFCSSV